MALPSLLHQAALALYRAGALPRHVRPQPHPAGRPAMPTSAPIRIRSTSSSWQGTVGRSFQRDEVREAVIPAYMGLIKQCDDQMGRLFAHLETKRPHGRHDDRPDLRPRRLSRRPLAGREGPVPRLFGPHPADRLRPAARGRRHARHRLRRAGGIDRPRANLHRGRRRQRAGPHPRRPLADAVPARRTARRTGASSRSANTTIRPTPAASAGSARSRATRGCSWS